MPLTRRPVLALLGLPALAATASAQTAAYPSRPIRLVIPFPPGGPTDVAARLIGQRLAEGLGQPVVADNRPGAGGTLGAGEVAKAPADGYTLLYGSASTLAIAPSIYKSLPYDTAQAFQPVALVSRGRQMLVVGSQVPVRNLKELVAWTRAHPDRASYASSGNGTPGHLTAELVKKLTGLKAQHIPFKGSAPAVQAVAAGDVTFIVDNIPTSAPFVQSGKLRALAVLGRQRAPQMADVPTFAEAGFPELEADFWSGLVVPAGTPDAIVARLNAAVRQAAEHEEFRARLAGLGMEHANTSPAEFAAFIRNETRRWAEVVRTANVTME